ncbi:MAG: hypothetical protein AAB368_16930, partial [bacterium]
GPGGQPPPPGRSGSWRSDRQNRQPQSTPPLAPAPEVGGPPGRAPAGGGGLGVGVVAAGQRLNLSWTANTEADLKDYRLRRGGSGLWASKTDLATVGAPGTTHQDGALANGTTYYYQVRARDVSGNESVESAEASGTPQDTTAPANPGGLGV